MCCNTWSISTGCVAAPTCGSTASKESPLEGAGLGAAPEFCAGPGAAPEFCAGRCWPLTAVWLADAGPLATAAEYCAAGSPPCGARLEPLGPPSWGGRGPNHGVGRGRPLSSIEGVGDRLDSLEASVGSVKAFVPKDKEGVTAVSRPVSVLSPSMVSRLSEDSAP